MKSQGFKEWKRQNRMRLWRRTGLAAHWRTLFRTTSFRIVLTFLGVFIVFSLVQFSWMRSAAEQMFMDQVEQTVSAEAEGLAEQYRRLGINRLIDVVNNRISRDSNSLYLILNSNGDTITGNISDVSNRALKAEGQLESAYRLAKDEKRLRRRALMQVFLTSEGYRLIVGHDLMERQKITQNFRRNARITILLTLFMGLIAAIMVARLVLRRIDAMTYKTYTIMRGDLSGRLPVSSRDDELDRLALSVNMMLERIEALMAGLKQVSDNVAHDLKTPLTRLRNKADEALRLAKGDEAHKAALEQVIDESDGLIRVFNALLLITRAEAGRLPQSMQNIDLATVVADVGELYEALVDDEGGSLTVETLPHAEMKGNRELIGQAVANLIDNAMKYGRIAEIGPEIIVRLVALRTGFAIEVADRGPGIAAEDRPRVLERFTRLEKSRTAPGFGIGLSLAAAVMKLHDGRIELDDNKPGLLVRLIFPKY